MGNAESVDSSLLTLGIKRSQAADKTIYQYVELTGGGELIQWAKYAMRSGDFNILDGFIEVKLPKFLYGNGKGKLMPIADLVKVRNKERNETLGPLRKKKGRGKSGPNILEDINQYEMQGDMMKALKFLDGGGKGGKGGSKYREIAWDIENRGVYGETLVNVSLLNGTAHHNELAKRIMKAYPKLVNDIFLSEDYYGLSPLHQAIVNEDPEMVRFLISLGADVHQRCVGALFCPDDQRTTRADSLEYEHVDVSLKTNYQGRIYWGEYPLSFAACLQQEDCYRLLRAAKADPNRQDTNGNAVLHLAVIHNLPDMFDLAYTLGAKLHLRNKQDLTPLTLAAKLARKKMFEHILKLERDVAWVYGRARSAAYPLKSIDSIDESTGCMNKNSALALIVYGGTEEHLDLLDGLMEDILEQKWHAFAKSRLRNAFLSYLLYYAIMFISFQTRPTGTPPIHPNCPVEIDLPNATTSEFTELLMSGDNLFDSYDGNSTANGTRGTQALFCFESELMQIQSQWDMARLSFELLTVIGAVVSVFSTLRTARMMGWDNFAKTLVQFPAATVHSVSPLFIILAVPFRLTCMPNYENICWIVAVLTTSFYFLFFCRGISFVGPFVLMIYKMIRGDMLRFFIIYGIFVFGFSQAFFVIFKYCGSASKVMDNPLEAFNRMFIINVGEFTTFFKYLNSCPSAVISWLGKLIFVIYELLVTIMLINMLIATMGRTYQQVAETRKEYKRQKAQVILLLEQWLKPRDRLMALLKYSRPIGTNKAKRSFVVVSELSDQEMDEMKLERERQWQKLKEEHVQATKHLRAESRMVERLTEQELIDPGSGDNEEEGDSVEDRQSSG